MPWLKRARSLRRDVQRPAKILQDRSPLVDRESRLRMNKPRAPFATLHRALTVPTLRLMIRFLSPSEIANLVETDPKPVVHRCLGLAFT